MGRSGGGSGRSSGGSGGRSSGGFSGGGRSSGGFSGGGGFGHRPGPGGPPPRHHWGPRFFGPRYGCGCGGGVFAIIILFILFIFSGFFNGCASLTSCSSFNYHGSYEVDVPDSTKEREPLEGVVTKTDWYEDNIGWISSSNTLISGLEDFYKATGIQPYVLFVAYSDEFWNGTNLDADAADEYLNEVYEEKFEDEGHFIFAYFQCENDSKQEMEGEFRYLSGYSADTVMDNEAINIFWGYFEANYYDTSLSIEEMISNTFTQTANNIMQTSSSSGVSVPMVLSIILIVIIVIVIIYTIVKNNKRRSMEQESKPADIIIEHTDEEK